MDQVASCQLTLFLCSYFKYRPGGSIGCHNISSDATRFIGVHNALELATPKYAAQLNRSGPPGAADEVWHALRLASVCNALRSCERGVNYDARALKRAMGLDKTNFVVSLPSGRDPKVEFFDLSRGPPIERDPTTHDISPYLEGSAYHKKQYEAVWLRWAEVERIGQLEASGETAELSLTPAEMPDFLATLMDGTWGGYACLRDHEWGAFERFWKEPFRFNEQIGDYLETALRDPDRLSQPENHPFIEGLEDEPSDDEEQSHVAKRARPADPTEGAGSQFDLTQDGSRSVRANPADDQVRCPQPPYT